MAAATGQCTFETFLALGLGSLLGGERRVNVTHTHIWHTAHCTWHTSHFTLNTEGTLDATPLPLNMAHCTLNAEQCKNALLQKLVLTSLCRLYFYLAVHDIGHRS